MAGQRLRMDVWKALEKLRVKTVRSLEFAPDLENGASCCCCCCWRMVPVVVVIIIILQYLILAWNTVNTGLALSGRLTNAG